MRIEELSTYEVIEKRKINDLNSESYILKHKKTGAKVVLLSNDDENKVFYIGFRTPPKDSTGVAHIIEHTVLCGSEKFPVKDPFLELSKGSLNTFLNAMTYPDKTLYPVASCNDKDFQNLMDVYLDAVFHPNIYKEEKIFKQEGWHYEMQDMDAPLEINGIVYNEMKGAFSSPDDVLEREKMNSLYPDTTYGIESGGDPDVIPELTYEAYLDFHRKYYHPSNSYIYLYGNMDMVEKLDFIDKKYLSSFDYKEVDSEITIQPVFSKVNRVVKEYSIGDEEKEEENYIFSYNFSIEDNLNRDLYIAFQIVDYALCSAPGAPLKQELTDKGIGTESYSNYENGIKQPFFSIVSKNTNLPMEKDFLSIINDVLHRIVDKGFDKKALLAGINYYEFKYREADFGSYPKGLMIGLQIMDSWLYDENKPFIHVEANETFEKLRKNAETDYFEKLISKYLINNTHKSLVILKPVKGLAEKNDNELADKLKAYKDSLGKEDKELIIKNTKELLEYQDRPDAEEDLLKIPLLSVKDLKKEANKFVNSMEHIDETEVLFHELFTNGISYLRLIFPMDEVPEDLFPYIPIFKGLLGLMNTEHFAYADLFNEINMITGGMSYVNNVYGNLRDENKCRITLEAKAKVLDQNLEKAFSLMREIMMTTDFSDKKRLHEIIAEGKSRMQGQMISAGHGIALNRALSYVSKIAAYNEILSGMDFYRLVEKIDANFEKEADDLISKLKELASIIFRPEKMMVDFIGSKEMLEVSKPFVQKFKKELYSGERRTGHYEPALSKKNEGYKTAGQVQYVCRAGNFKHAGVPYTGALKVLKVMMGYDYLWSQIRVKGGAYGCMCNFGKSGESYFVSYRDPNLKNTNTVYEKAADYIESYQADDRTLTQFIIGAISDLDIPMNPSAKGLYSLSGFMSEMTDEDLQRERDQIISCNAEDIRQTAEQIRAFMKEDCFCVVGSAKKIEEAKELFGTVENLVG